MKLSTRVSLAAAVLSLFGTGAAIAGDKIVLASLGDVQGKVLVNKGNGYVTAKAGMEVAPGDRIVALEDASAKILYQDGCVTSLPENNILAIDGKGCAAAPVHTRSEPIRLAEALGGRTGVPGGSGPGTPVVGGFGGGFGGGGGGIGLFGALVVGSQVGATLLLNHHAGKDDKPVSAH